MPYSLKLLLLGLLTLPVGILIIALAPFDRDGRLAYHLTRFWTWSIIKVFGIQIKVQGLERLDPNQPYIFVANHRSYIDIPALMQALLGFQLRWIAKRELLWIPLFGWAMWSAKHIVVNRQSVQEARISLRKAKEKIERGISVVIFPEGTRSVGDELLPFKRGGFLLAIQTKMPIVPVTIRGSGAVLPKGIWHVRGGQIEVTVGEPIPVDQYGVQDLTELMTRVRETIEPHLHHHAAAVSAPPGRALGLTNELIRAER
ncbi:MAG: 1-acylglycerol-3-phosphate O-acyltransferase [Deltaproteobacteria bacterium]|nr:1-acylglycerol-3-phosphate O-acyltransferase [Deltaproteobacteria bacterium]